MTTQRRHLHGEDETALMINNANDERWSCGNAWRIRNRTGKDVCSHDERWSCGNAIMMHNEHKTTHSTDDVALLSSELNELQP